MSAYTDYMAKLAVGFSMKAERFGLMLLQGKRECCLERQVQVLYMMQDAIHGAYGGTCIDDDTLLSMCNFINDELLKCNIGSITVDDIIDESAVISGAGTSTSSSGPEEQSWNLIIGTTPVRIDFNEALGTSGYTWAMQYTCTNSFGDSTIPTITGRDATGFTVKADSDGTRFEGTARLVNI